MAILNIQLGSVGLTGVTPRIVYIMTNNTLSDVLATGFLNQAVQNGFSFSETDMALVGTKLTPSSAATQLAWLDVSHVGANWSLTSTNSPGSVTLPTVPGYLVHAADTIGTLTTASDAVTNVGAINSGLVAGGTVGLLRAYPTTASSGFIAMQAAVNASGNFGTTISNSLAQAQSQTLTVGDVGAATGGLVASTTIFVMKKVVAAAAAGGAAAQSFTDTFCSSTSVVVGNWVTQANAASVLTIVPGNGSFVVTSSADAGVGTFSYTILK